MTPTPEEVRAAQVKRILDERADQKTAAEARVRVLEDALREIEAMRLKDFPGACTMALAAVSTARDALAAADTEPLTEAERRAREEAWGERYAADAADTEPHGKVSEPEAERVSSRESPQDVSGSLTSPAVRRGEGEQR